VSVCVNLNLCCFCTLGRVRLFTLPFANFGSLFSCQGAGGNRVVFAGLLGTQLLLLFRGKDSINSREIYIADTETDNLALCVVCVCVCLPLTSSPACHEFSVQFLFI